MIYRWPAAALGQLGRAAEAKEWLEKANSYAPAAFKMYVHNRVPWFRAEDHAHLVEGLRKAGWEGWRVRPRVTAHGVGSMPLQTTSISSRRASFRGDASLHHWQRIRQPDRP